MEITDLKQMTKEEVFNFIRQRLSFSKELQEQFRHVNKDDLAKEHRRFEMSGNESKTGQCTIFNTAILNEFADLGIYDYTSYLFLDFHNGTPTVYLKYFSENENLEYTFTGYTTTEIIFAILELTIFSGKPKRKQHLKKDLSREKERKKIQKEGSDKEREVHRSENAVIVENVTW